MYWLISGKMSRNSIFYHILKRMDGTVMAINIPQKIVYAIMFV